MEIGKYIDETVSGWQEQRPDLDFVPMGYMLRFHAMAEAAMAMGFYISISGIVTFKNAKALQEVAKMIPEDKLLVETDSPFLAPVPHRGRVCEPAYVSDTAAFVAGLRGTDVEHLKKVTTANFFNLFNKAGR